jgi:hypothetical protein
MTVNSTYGFPYPQSTEPVANGAQNIQDLASAVDSKIGFFKIIPTGAVNGTVSPDGDVTIGSGVGSVTVQGAFSSLFDNYKMIYQTGDASSIAILYMKFNNSTGSTYSYGGGYTLFGITSFVGEQENNTSNGIRIGNTNVDLSSTVTEIISPFLATPTHVMSQHADHQYFSVRGGRDSNAASQTGFSLVAGAGTLTGGIIRVYGYRN